MSEMVERVARAIWGVEYPGASYPTCGPHRAEVERKARAAIEAMREPTDLMYMIGGNTEPYRQRAPGRKRGSRIGDMPARDAWRAMIDVALNSRY